jgi:cold shock CspA family protein
MSKATGVSKWFSRLKGYGYINPDDDGYDGDIHNLDLNDDDYLGYFKQDRGRKESRVKSNDLPHK